MNNMLGFNLFSDNTWKDSPEEIGKRLNLSFEHTGYADKTLYSAYTQLPCLGTKLYQLKINYSESIESLSIILANKGDISKNEQDYFSRIFRKSLNATLNRLETTLGKVKKSHDTYTWYYDDAIIVLYSIKNEFLTLVISPNNKQKSINKHGQNLRNRQVIQNIDYSDNVERNDFGDCYIRNIPMINQGQKGYCVPATIERTLLYFNITSFDMHELANMLRTDPNNGTSYRKSIPELCNILMKNGIKTKLQKLNMRVIKSAINEGGLVIWCFSSYDNFENRAMNNTSIRSTIPLDNWRKHIHKQKRLAKGNKCHMNLIIGYNETTKELAISDSWGNKYALRWIPYEDAEELVDESVVVVLPK